ncbi:hypothetical protein DPSP01_007545 [Paraphaeosphaeria sporulosa]
MNLIPDINPPEKVLIFAAELYAVGEKMLDEAFSDAVLNSALTAKNDHYNSISQGLFEEAAAILCEGALEESEVNEWVSDYYELNGEVLAKVWPREALVDMQAVFPLEWNW